jgi:hypothetical protein
MGMLGQFLVTVLSGVSGAVVALGGAQLLAFFGRPQLHITEDIPETGTSFSCHAIRVRNTGRSTAEKCIGALTIPGLGIEDLVDAENILKLVDLGIPIQKFGVHGGESFLMNGSAKSAKSFRPIEGELLAWSRIGNPVEVNLPPGVGTTLDLCRYVNNDATAQIDLPSEKGWSHVRAVLKAKRYEFIVTVYAANAGHCQKSFNVVPEVKGGLTIRAAGPPAKRRFHRVLTFLQR